MSQNSTAAAAFDPSATAAERFDAQAELQSSHIDRANLIPPEHLKPLIEYLVKDMREQDMAKSASVVVPFPSKGAGKKGVQSVVIDDLNYAINGEYIERPGAMNFSVLRGMVEQTPVLSAVIMTRVRQVQAFAKVQESGFGPGFVIRHADKAHKLTDEERKTTELLQRFFLNTGWEFNPRQRKRLGRQSLRQFLAMSVRDSLTMDSAPIETEYKRNKALGIDGFYAVDGATIRLCTEEGYRGDDEIFALQVVQGNIRTAYDYNGLIYEPRNPRTDVMSAGYGLSETELLIKVVTGFLNAMTLNIRGFSDNSIPKGVLHLSGNYSETDLAAFKRYWNGMVKGVNNAWSVPVLVSKDQESKAEFENFGVEFNEMMFSRWMTFLTSLICAIYGMSPAEINFDSFSGGNTSPLGGSDTAEKLAASKDSGLRPLLAYYESLFSDYVLADFGDSYVFRWTGVDDDDQDKRHELKKLVMNVNEMRAELGLEAQDASWGEAPLNPSLIGPWSQEQQAAQQPGPDMQSADQAPGFGGDDQNGQDGDQAGDDGAPGDDQGEDGQPGQDQKQADPGADPGDQPMRKATGHGGNDIHVPGTGRFGEKWKLTDEKLDKTIDPVVLNLEGWSGNRADIGRLAQSWYSSNLQGKSFENDDMGVPVLCSSEGKGTAFATSGNTRDGWKAEMVRALPDLIKRAIKVQEVKPDERRTKDTKMFHTLVSALSVNGKRYTAKLTVREALESKASHPHKFYDVAALEIENGPEVSGLKDSGLPHRPLPTPSGPLSISVRTLVSVVKGIDLMAKAIPTSSLLAAAKRAQPDGDEEPKPHPSSYGVGVHDEVFFHHPQHGATSGKVLAYGADGFTAEHKSGRVGVPWDALLGHKQRAERTLTTVEAGEAGSIVKDEATGRQHFLAGNAAEFDGEDPELDDERALILGTDNSKE